MLFKSKDASKKVNASARLILQVSGFVLFFLSSIQSPYAEFNLNFTPDDGNYVSNDAYVSCGMSYLSDANCASGGMRGGDFNLNGSHDDGTPFYQRMFTDASGDSYYHVIVGDYLLDDFAQEVIIKANGTQDGNWYTGFRGNIARSASAGDSNDRLYNMSNPYDVGVGTAKTGTGSGNPTRVIMRQILTDNAQTTMEFVKDQFSNKPLITQTTYDVGFTSYFELDMRNKSYSDITPIDPFTEMVHITTLLGPEAPPDGRGDYDFSDKAETAYFTAGGYTYEDGTNFGGSYGTYNYMDDEAGDIFQPTDLDYNIFCDTEQNTDWSGNGACTNADGTGGGFGGGRRRGGW